MFQAAVCFIIISTNIINNIVVIVVVVYGSGDDSYVILILLLPTCSSFVPTANEVTKNFSQHGNSFSSKHATFTTSGVVGNKHGLS